MRMSLEIQGQKELAALAAGLHKAAATFQNDMLTSVADAVKPLQSSVPRSALSTLPKRGGLAKRVAASRYSIQRRGNIIRFATTNAYNIKQMDAGTVRHPVYGNRAKWVSQSVPPSWWTKPITQETPRIVRDMQREMQRIVNRIGG